MKIFITGGAGFIGSNLVRQALAHGHEVLNLDALTYAGNQVSLRDVETRPGYRFAQVDITDAAAVEQVVQGYSPDCIMHLAAESHVDRSIDGPGQFIQTNIVGTFNLLQSARRLHQSLPASDAEAFRFLHVSTDEVYGSLGSDGAFTETTSYDPHSPYSASKASSDHLARAWRDTYGLPVLVTNCSNNYGPYQFPEKLIPVVILKCLAGDPIPVYGRGDNVRDWLHVEDHCGALLRVATAGQPGETYNIGGNNERTNLELVQTLCRLMDRLHPRDAGPHEDLITFVTDRPGHDRRYAIDATKLKAQLGWQPRRGHDDGFEQTVRWYLENRDWWQSILSGDYRMDRIGQDNRAPAVTAGVLS